jgi:putative membrane protein
MQKIPHWLKGLLDEAGLRKIDAAVAQAEQQTSGEIVPMVVRSSAVHSSASMIGVLLALLLVLLVEYATLLIRGHEDLGWLWLAAYLVAGALGYAFGQTRKGQLLTLAAWDRRRQVDERALLEFYQEGLNNTQGKTGILLFLSLDEHGAVVLADAAISKHYPKDTFKEVVAELVEGARNKDLATGFVKAIDRSAALLSPYFPPEGANPNELADHIRIKE